jgi:glycerol-3-phosphate dehydrogenase (NAD(P)+)
MDRETQRVAVIGAGSWGTALAAHLATLGRPVRLWAFEPEVAEAVNERHENPLFLAGFRLPPELRATTDGAEALDGATLVLSVMPSHVVRSVWERLGSHLAPDAVLVSASKGIEGGTCLMMHQVLAEVVPGLTPARFACLSGPSFAREVIAGLPCAVVAASEDEATARRVQVRVSGPTFRVYTTDDVVGTEMGGALKNVVAIAVGASDGLGLGLNARAALITRGLAEITRAAVAAGAQPLTLAGLAGMGDLVLTCTGALSRNRHVGEELGKGRRLPDILGGMRMVAEGVRTTRSTMELNARLGVEMPITEQVDGMLYRDLPPAEATAALMGRSLRSEREF